MSCIEEKDVVQQPLEENMEEDMEDYEGDTTEEDICELKEQVGVIQHDLEVIKSLLQKYIGLSQGGPQDVLSSSIGMDKPLDPFNSMSTTVSPSSSAATMSATPMQLTEPLTLSMNTPSSTPRSKCWVHPLELNVQRAKM